MEYYLIGSLRNLEIPVIAEYIRRRAPGIEIFDEWWSASEDADDWLQEYFKGRNFNYKEMLNSYVSKHIFEFDKRHLDRVDGAILAMPAGKSGHLELGYMAGLGKPTYILFDKEPERLDQMHQFATDIFFNIDELVEQLKKDRDARQVG